MKSHQRNQGGFEHVVIKRSPELRHEKRPEAFLFHQFELVAHGYNFLVLNFYGCSSCIKECSGFKDASCKSVALRVYEPLYRKIEHQWIVLTQVL